MMLDNPQDFQDVVLKFFILENTGLMFHLLYQLRSSNNLVSLDFLLQHHRDKKQ